MTIDDDDKERKKNKERLKIEKKRADNKRKTKELKARNKEAKRRERRKTEETKRIADLTTAEAKNERLAVLVPKQQH